VADKYTTRNAQTIFEVTLSGNEQFTIDLDISVRNQSVIAREALKKVATQMNWCSSINKDMSAADFIFQNPMMNDNALTVAALKEHGIWLLYGELHPSIKSGYQDKGIQYAVIDDQCVTISKQVSPHDIG
jgi:hypothetical protein